MGKLKMFVLNPNRFIKVGQFREKIVSITLSPFDESFVSSLRPRFYLIDIKDKFAWPSFSFRGRFDKFLGGFIPQIRFVKFNGDIITSIMIRASLKTAVAAGFVYFTVEQGVWKDSETTVQLYNQIQESVTPYTNELKKQIPQLPELNFTVSPITWWNEGVKASCSFLNNTPGYVTEYSQKIANHPEVQKVIDSFKATSTETKS